MSDVSYTLKADVRRNTDNVPGKGEGFDLKVVTATKSVTSRTANDTLKMVRLPSNARICGLSKLSFDDLASSGAPTIDIGVAPVNDAGNAITADADALNDGIDVATAAGTANVVKDHANYGKQLWQYVSGLTSDPGTLMDVYLSFVDANTNATGDVTIEMVFSFD
jgi:hypothetical protein